MRVLVIGFPLPDPQIDNYNFLSAPSFFDYDALVVDTASVSRTIEEVVDQSQERPPTLSNPWSTGLLRLWPWAWPTPFAAGRRRRNVCWREATW